MVNNRVTPKEIVSICLKIILVYMSYYKTFLFSCYTLYYFTLLPYFDQIINNLRQRIWRSTKKVVYDFLLKYQHFLLFRSSNLSIANKQVLFKCKIMFWVLQLSNYKNTVSVNFKIFLLYRSVWKDMHYLNFKIFFMILLCINLACPIAIPGRWTLQWTKLGDFNLFFLCLIAE